MIHRHVAKECDLGTFTFGNFAFGTAQKNVRIDTLFAQLLHGVLCGLGLQFAGSRHPGAQRQVNEAGVVTPHAETHLANGFDEGQGFNIAHGAADFHHSHIAVSVARILGTAHDIFLNFVGDMRNHLNRLAEVLAAAFLFKNALINLPGREVVITAHLRGDETFVMPQIKVGLRAVFRHEHFAVLERTHRARIHVDIGIELDHRHLKSAGLKDCS